MGCREVLPGIAPHGVKGTGSLRTRRTPPPWGLWAVHGPAGTSRDPERPAAEVGRRERPLLGPRLTAADVSQVFPVRLSFFH